MPARNRNTQGGKSVTSDLAPRSSRTNSGQVHTNWIGSLPRFTTPTLSTYSYGADGAFTFTITNYDATATYVLSTTAGSITRSTNIVTVSGLGNGGTATASVTAQKSGFSNSATATVVGQSKPACVSCGAPTVGVNGCNGATCGIIACGSGTCPAYDSYTYYSPSPNPCVGCASSVGGWYCCACGGACG